MPNPDKTWKALSQHASTIQQLNIGQLHASRKEANMCAESSALTLDYNFQRISPETLSLLEELFNACDVSGRVNAMLSGDHINTTENRQALHTSLRLFSEPGGCPHEEEIRQASQTTEKLAERIATRQPAITDVVNIGIGGSDLGPRMASQALSAYSKADIKLHFVSSLDPAEFDTLAKQLDPASTLFIVSSKSFGTEETLVNAERAKAWLANTQPALVAQNMVAVSANIDKATAWGIAEENILPIWDWVGGRYSIWSAISLPIILGMGLDTFKQFLAGAASMDRHFQNQDFRDNLPMILAGLEIWNRNLLDLPTLAVLPYSYRLRLLPKYLQQLVMESNGKSVTLAGDPVSQATSSIVWGEAGTEGQHSFCQLLHQGTQTVPVDFILPLNDAPLDDQNRLVAHCLAQRTALAFGESRDTIEQQLIDDGLDAREASQLAAHKAIKGDKPSSLLIMQELSPFSLGELIALYEHKTFACSVIWDINPFDQWGVELGKRLSNSYYQQLDPDTKLDSNADPVIDQIKKLQR